jgi:anaerobic selenocysteine-containing dehydrogenase
VSGRSFTANAIYRDPTWRRRDAAGALRISPQDAERIGLSDGGVVEVTDTMQPGHIAVPNGLGVDHPEHGLVGYRPTNSPHWTPATNSPEPKGISTCPPGWKP